MKHIDLACILDLSAATVYRRVNRLLTEDVIKITAVPDTAKVGFLASTMIMMNVDLRKVDKIANKLATYQNINFVAISSGRFHIIAHVQFRSPQKAQ
jgi:DNA-binding Lrp family transcriptional regulator